MPARVTETRFPALTIMKESAMQDLAATLSQVTAREWAFVAMTVVQVICTAVQVWAWTVIRRFRLSRQR